MTYDRGSSCISNKGTQNCSLASVFYLLKLRGLSCHFQAGERNVTWRSLRSFVLISQGTCASLHLSLTTNFSVARAGDKPIAQSCDGGFVQSQTQGVHSASKRTHSWKHRMPHLLVRITTQLAPQYLAYSTLLRSTCGARWRVRPHRTPPWRSTCSGRWTEKTGWIRRSTQSTCALGVRPP